jgi:hypothetical protein
MIIAVFLLWTHLLYMPMRGFDRSRYDKEALSRYDTSLTEERCAKLVSLRVMLLTHANRRGKRERKLCV